MPVGGTTRSAPGSHALRPEIQPQGPVWFVRRPTDHRPAVLQLPASLHWFETEAGPGCWLEGVAWVPVRDRLAAVALPGPVAVLAPGVLRGSDGSLVDARQGHLERYAPGRRGLDVVLTRRAGRWSADRLSLPEGARRARQIQPFATGVGVVWTDGGWLYRWRDGEAPRAIGPFGRERLQVGPDGAVLVGDGEHWTRVAGPRSAMQPLEEPLVADMPVRFSRSGRRLTGATRPGVDEAVLVDAATGRIRVRRPGALPLTERTFVEPGAPHAPGVALLASDPVFRDGLLGGPGGRVWDLDIGAAVRDALLGAGPHVACADGWATHDGDGVVRWLDPRTGVDRSEVALDLHEGEEPVVAWAVGPVAVFGTSHGRRLAVDPHGTVPVPPGEPPVPPWMPCPQPWAALGFEAMVQHGDRAWLVSSLGHLATVPGGWGEPG